jgi:serine/threonine protein phosphatase PrpC
VLQLECVSFELRDKFGEDAIVYLHDKKLLAVFDGLGGLGGALIKFDDNNYYTEAYLASRHYSEYIKELFEDELSSIFLYRIKVI